MISHTHKFILILPPKTASTTLVTALRDFVDISKIIKQPKSGTYDFKEGEFVGGENTQNLKHIQVNI